MSHFSDSLTLKEGLTEYFKRSGFDDSTYRANWVIIPLGPVPLYLPNIHMRKIAVRTHDLNHVLTEFETNWTGESLIAAWEVASGCKKAWVAWFLNMTVLPLGLLACPARSLRAFAGGRKSRNLYGIEYNDELLSKKIGDLRKTLGVQSQAANISAGDFAAYVFWFVICLFPMTANGVLIFGLPVAAIVLILKALGLF